MTRSFPPRLSSEVSRDHRGVGHEAVFGVEAHVVTVDHDREADRLAVGPLVPLPVPAVVLGPPVAAVTVFAGVAGGADEVARSAEHTSELQSLMRLSYAVFCLTKKKTENNDT